GWPAPRSGAFEHLLLLGVELLLGQHALVAQLGELLQARDRVVGEARGGRGGLHRRRRGRRLLVAGVGRTVPLPHLLPGKVSGSSDRGGTQERASSSQHLSHSPFRRECSRRHAAPPSSRSDEPRLRRANRPVGVMWRRRVPAMLGRQNSKHRRCWMATLVAIAYPDQGTAEEARGVVQTLEADLVIQADQVAAISRDPDGKYHVTTTHGGATAGAGAWWGGFWGMLFGLLFFIPFAGLAIGAGFGALFGHLGKNAIDKHFQEQVRDQLKPGTSALFLVIEKVTPDKAIAALSKYGGTVMRTSLSDEDTAKLQEALSNQQPVSASS